MRGLKNLGKSRRQDDKIARNKRVGGEQRPCENGKNSPGVRTDHRRESKKCIQQDATLSCQTYIRFRSTAEMRGESLSSLRHDEGVKGGTLNGRTTHGR